MTAFAFKPTLYSRIYQETLENQLVGMKICNTTYEGEMAYGNRVQVWVPGPVPNYPYTVNVGNGQNSTVPDDTEEYLDINVAREFKFTVDVLNQTQGRLDPTGAYQQNGIYGLANHLDAAVLAQYANVHANNVVYPAAAVTSATIEALFATAAQKMSERNAPTINGWYCVVSPRVKQLINSAVSGRGTMLADVAMANGYVGSFRGFAIYESNNVVVTKGAGTGAGTGSKVVHKCLFGCPAGMSLVQQIPVASIKQFDPTPINGIGIKGLLLYGLKMWRSGILNGVINVWFEA